MDIYYKVYIKINENNEIIDINSDAFLNDTTSYIEVDEGVGDKYHHAQGNYLNKPIVDEYGRYNYLYVDGEIVEIAEADKPSISPPEPTAGERIEALEAALLEVVLGG